MHAVAGRGRTAAAVDRRWRTAEARAAGACSTRLSSSRLTASARCRASTTISPYVLPVNGIRVSGRVRAGGVNQWSLWRQFELARADLVPCQLSADRIAAEVSPLLRRRLQGRVSDRFRQVHDVVGGGCRDIAPLTQLFLRRTRRPRPVHGSDALPARSALARPGAVLRILPRR